MIELFKRPLIPAQIDATWVNPNAAAASLKRATMLVLARAYNAASTEEATLTNMLNACGFHDDDVAVLQVEEEDQLSWAQLRSVVQPSFVLLLGIPPAQLLISAMMPANAAVEFGGVTFIWTSTLQHLTSTEAARKSLWQDVLQPLFRKA